ncbi:MAG: hypothetical protein DRH08_04585 [Deltaproteobacteria bacterium]|nr:MAG: hypothetical protein DRH08_04585 [Deltaproteobacteria bacterium]
MSLYRKGMQQLARLRGEHGVYAVLSLFRDARCFNYKDIGELGSVPGVKGIIKKHRRRADVVTKAHKDKEAL